jgi:hypothetical protein
LRKVETIITCTKQITTNFSHMFRPSSLEKALITYPESFFKLVFQRANPPAYGALRLK